MSKQQGNTMNTLLLVDNHGEAVLSHYDENNVDSSNDKWSVFLENASLLDEIRKDVVRTHPDLKFFLEPHDNLGHRRYAAMAQTKLQQSNNSSGGATSTTNTTGTGESTTNGSENNVAGVTMTSASQQGRAFLTGAKDYLSGLGREAAKTYQLSRRGATTTTTTNDGTAQSDNNGTEPNKS
jgi:hypothetical protein